MNQKIKTKTKNAIKANFFFFIILLYTLNLILKI